MKPLVLAMLAGVAAALSPDPLGGKTDVASQFCYNEEYTPHCAPGKLCAQMVVPGIVCPWACGERAPDACQPRRKPCRGGVCKGAHDCEVMCPIGGDGTAVAA